MRTIIRTVAVFLTVVAVAVPSLAQAAPDSRWVTPSEYRHARWDQTAKTVTANFGMRGHRHSRGALGVFITYDENGIIEQKSGPYQVWYYPARYCSHVVIYYVYDAPSGTWRLADKDGYFPDRSSC